MNQLDLFRAIRQRLLSRGFDGKSFAIEPIRARPWSSATFSGDRVAFDLMVLCADTDNLTTLADRALELVTGGWDPQLVGVQLMDMEPKGRRREGSEERMRFEALTLNR